MNNNCIFCKIVAKQIPSRILYENEYVLAFLDVSPVTNGHSLIIPKKHFDNLTSVEQPYFDEVNHARQLIANKLKASSLNVQGFNYLSNENDIAGQSVSHYHEHIIPKYEVGIGFNLKDAVNPINLKDLDEIYNLLTEKTK